MPLARGPGPGWQPHGRGRAPRGNHGLRPVGPGVWGKDGKKGCIPQGSNTGSPGTRGMGPSHWATARDVLDLGTIGFWGGSAWRTELKYSVTRTCTRAEPAADAGGQQRARAGTRNAGARRRQRAARRREPGRAGSLCGGLLLRDGGCCSAI